MDKTTKKKILDKLCDAVSEIDSATCELSKGKSDTILSATKSIDEVIETLEREL